MDQPAPIRSSRLTLICILTFVGSGLMTFTNFSMFAFFDVFKQVYQEGGLEPFRLSKEQMEVISLMFSVSPAYYLFQAMAYGSSLMGAVFMWKLRKPGFHLYAIAQIMVMIIQQIYMPSLPFPTAELLVTILFIVLYARHLPEMK